MKKKSVFNSELLLKNFQLQLLVLVLTCFCISGIAFAGDVVNVTKVGLVHSLRVPLNGSVIINLPVNARDVVVSNPNIADVVVRSKRQSYILGVGVGKTNIYFLGKNGQKIVLFELDVAKDIRGISREISSLFPGSRIKVGSVGNGLVLSGSVRDPQDAEAAVAYAMQAAGSQKVVNLLTVDNSAQVLLKVVIAEMKRSATKNLGITISKGTLNPLKMILNSHDHGEGFSFKGDVAAASGFKLLSLNRSKEFGLSIQALEQMGAARVLAEPNLTTVSGKAASFFAGGEIPIPSDVSESGSLSIKLERVGVGLAFTPTVLSSGRIRLKLKTNVREIDTSVSLKNDKITVPGFLSRTADSSVELPSGGTIAVAGLMSSKVRTSKNLMPFLGSLPIVGSFFRNTNFTREDTELVISVTPYLVKPVSPSMIKYPTDNLVPGNDVDRIILNSDIKVTKKPKGTIAGKFGGIGEFIIQ